MMPTSVVQFGQEIIGSIVDLLSLPVDYSAKFASQEKSLAPEDQQYLYEIAGQLIGGLEPATQQPYLDGLVRTQVAHLERYAALMHTELVQLFFAKPVLYADNLIRLKPEDEGQVSMSVGHVVASMGNLSKGMV